MNNNQRRLNYRRGRKRHSNTHNPPTTAGVADVYFNSANDYLGRFLLNEDLACKIAEAAGAYCDSRLCSCCGERYFLLVSHKVPFFASTKDVAVAAAAQRRYILRCLLAMKVLEQD